MYKEIRCIFFVKQVEYITIYEFVEGSSMGFIDADVAARAHARLRSHYSDDKELKSFWIPVLTDGIPWVGHFETSLVQSGLTHPPLLFV
jgi:hypothetical protein